MTVGESLTEARYQAGLSVDELSERTRIRDSVIRSIERDDYEACGGDLYVRGYVRAIAGAVGIDAQPLIQEFDQERVHGANGAGNVNGVGGVNGAGGANGARPYVPLAAVSAVSAAPRLRPAERRPGRHLVGPAASATRVRSGPPGPRRDALRPAGGAR